MFGNVEKRLKNPKNLKIVRRRPNASNCFRMRPNASQWVRMDPKASKNSRKHRKTCENFEKLRENFEKLRENCCKNFFHGVVLLLELCHCVCECCVKVPKTMQTRRSSVKGFDLPDDKIMPSGNYGRPVPPDSLKFGGSSLFQDQDGRRGGR